MLPSNVCVNIDFGCHNLSDVKCDFENHIKLIYRSFKWLRVTSIAFEVVREARCYMEGKSMCAFYTQKSK